MYIKIVELLFIHCLNVDNLQLTLGPTIFLLVFHVHSVVCLLKDQ